MCFSVFFALSLCKQTVSRLWSIVIELKINQSYLITQHVACSTYQPREFQLFRIICKLNKNRLRGATLHSCITLTCPSLALPENCFKITAFEWNAPWRPPDLSGLLHDRQSINWHVSSACVKCCFEAATCRVMMGIEMWNDDWNLWEEMFVSRKRRIWTWIWKKKLDHFLSDTTI